MRADRPNVVGIVQARMTSTRLPGKILREVLGKPLLAYELERLARIPELTELVVATTVNREDDPVVALCDKLRVKSFRGSEQDVLSRYYEAATLYEADVVVRFTADCPLIDPGIASDIISFFLSSSEEYDYVGIDHDKMPRGMDAEVFSYEALKFAHENGHGAADREHVTWYIYHHQERFRIFRYSMDENLGKYRLTVDTPEDFKLIEEIIGKLDCGKPMFDIGDIVKLLEASPALFAINSGVSQKTYN